jgi:hypothetical protein
MNTDLAVGVIELPQDSQEMLDYIDSRADPVAWATGLFNSVGKIDINPNRPGVSLRSPGWNA